MLEFPVDDTAGGEKEDALTEMGFYVPKDAPGLPGAPGAGEDEHAAKVRSACKCMHAVSPPLPCAMHACRLRATACTSALLHANPCRCKRCTMPSLARAMHA